MTAAAAARPSPVAVDPATNTVYAASDTPGNPFLGDTVYVISGPAPVTPQPTTATSARVRGYQPVAVRADLGRIRSALRARMPTRSRSRSTQATDTIYTPTSPTAERAWHRVGHQRRHLQRPQRERLRPDPLPLLLPGFGASAIAVDPTHNRVYATNIEDTSITTIDGHTCNGTKTNGCQITRTRPIVGDYPGAISVAPAVRKPHTSLMRKASR